MGRGLAAAGRQLPAAEWNQVVRVPHALPPQVPQEEAVVEPVHEEEVRAAGGPGPTPEVRVPPAAGRWGLGRARGSPPLGPRSAPSSPVRPASRPSAAAAVPPPLAGESGLGATGGSWVAAAGGARPAPGSSSPAPAAPIRPGARLARRRGDSVRCR